MNGIIVIDKEKNVTSRDVVNKVSKILNIKKIGHTGTLDPIATGVLVLCVGRATKLVDMITGYDKEYIARACLGILTDTLDITGNILYEENFNISKEKIVDVLNSFIGEYEQEVPLYSAVKIDGKKLYEYGRSNIDIELPKRNVKINSIKLVSDIDYKNGKVYFSFLTNVSKGTYIRSLINDIGKSLGTYGTMIELRRIKQGNFKIEDSFSYDNLKIISIEDVLKKYYAVELDDELYKKVSNGVKLKDIYNQDIVVFKYNNKTIAVYKKSDEYIKPYKMLI